MFKLSQETIAIVTVGLALAGLILTTTSGIRDEARADREAFRSEMQAMRAEARADREALRSEMQALRDEARADREAIRAEAHAAREAMRAEAHAAREALHAEARADREAFEKHITRLTQEQSRLTGMVEQMRTASAR